MQNNNHNYDFILASIYFVYRKIAQIKEIIDQIANHAKTGIPLQQKLIYLCFSQKLENRLFKNRDVYNKRQQIRQYNLNRLTSI